MEVKSLSIQELTSVKALASSIAKTSLPKSKNENEILAIILLAQELGLPIMQCLAGGINILSNNYSLSARMVNLMIRNAKHFIEIQTYKPTICVVRGKRCDTHAEFTVTYTLEDAATAQLTSRNQNYQKFPREMLFCRAISILGRTLFPDVLGNAYVDGELPEKDSEKDSEKAPDVGYIEVVPDKQDEISDSITTENEKPKVEEPATADKSSKSSPKVEQKTKEVLSETVYLTPEQHEELIAIASFVGRDDLVIWLEKRKGQITIETYNQFKEKFA